MGSHKPPKKYPGRMSNRFALNTCTPHAGAMRKLAQGVNFGAAHLRKQVACHTRHTTSGYIIGTLGASGTTRPWNFPFRSGVGVSAIDFAMVIVPADNGSATDPRIRVRLHDVSGASSTYTQYFRHRDLVATSPFSWSRAHLVRGSIAVPAEETFYVISPELEDYASINSFLAFERAGTILDDTDNGVCDPTAFEDGRQVLDADVQNVIAAQYDQWRANGRHWLQAIESLNDVTSTSYVNLKDGTTTSVTSATHGFSLWTQYHDSRSSTTVPAEMGIMVNRTAGAGTLAVRLYDGSNALFEVTGIGNTEFQVFTVDFTANNGTTKYDLQAKVSDGSTTFEVGAVSVWTYEA